MSATQPTTPGLPFGTEPASERAAASELAHLALLHHEAVETAQLANLLGRAPYAAAMLAIASGFVAVFVLLATPSAELVAWLILMLFGIVAVARAYGRTIRAPFERAPLEAFAKDLSAILTYSGFAWGAGGFLALPAGTGAIEAVAFAILPALLVTLLLRARGASLLFLGPAALLPAFAMVLRPMTAGAPSAALTLALAAAVAGLAAWLEPPVETASLADLPLGGGIFS